MRPGVLVSSSLSLSISVGLALAVGVAGRAPAATPPREVQLPPRSPAASVTQVVGLTTISVEYNSPAVARRKLWTSVVPPGVLWRTGEGPVPVVRFSRDVVVVDQAVRAGSYSLLTIPTDTSWTIILNRDTKLTSMAAYRPDLDVARVQALVSTVPYRERLTFLFSDFSTEQASLDLEWETRRVSIPIRVRTNEQVMAAIHSLDELWRRYADTAAYMLDTKKDYEAGLKYINRSIALKENWYNFWVKASLLAAKGDYAGARESADRAYQLGLKSSDGKLFQPAIKQGLDTWARSAGEQRPPSLAKAWADRPPAAAPPSLPPELSITDGDFAPRPFTISEPARTGAVAIIHERSVRVRRAEGAADRTKPPAAAEIGPLIRKGRSDIQACYQRALRQDPTLTRERITISINVGVSGVVKNVVFSPPHPSGPLESCIREAISRWAFPLSPVEYGTEFPIVLRGKE